MGRRARRDVNCLNSTFRSGAPVTLVQAISAKNLWPDVDPGTQDVHPVVIVEPATTNHHVIDLHMI
jgi:hypothetical protein